MYFCLCIKIDSAFFISLSVNDTFTTFEIYIIYIELYQFLRNLDTLIASTNSETLLVVKADQYPFNILTEYSKQMTAEGNKTVISDLNYILTQLPEDQRVALVNAVYQLIEQAKAGTLGGNAG